ncbi:hypothetical protein GGR56DRAFT_212746 [Xylariaceae sp. FL0804]|nr:hypothetical protein GGR56DRAFT_212746 [Xylariaceae sp. FL0804]
MKNQQQAEREEQQRIKNLVLNYDLRENEDADDNLGHERLPSYQSNRADRSNRDRGGQRVRRLQLSDVDWYERTQRSEESGKSGRKSQAMSVDDACQKSVPASSQSDRNISHKRRM